MSTSKILKDYLSEHNLNRKELSRELGVPESTLNDWINKDIPFKRIRAKYRKILRDKFPEVFEETTAGVSETKVIPSSNLDLKIQYSRLLILQISMILESLIFNGSTEKRNYFRASLGKEWLWFIELTRAMVGEKALEVIKEEGRLHLERRPQ